MLFGKSLSFQDLSVSIFYKALWKKTPAQWSTCIESAKLHLPVIQSSNISLGIFEDSFIDSFIPSRHLAGIGQLLNRIHVVNVIYVYLSTILCSRIDLVTFRLFWRSLLSDSVWIASYTLGKCLQIEYFGCVFWHFTRSINELRPFPSNNYRRRLLRD